MKTPSRFPNILAEQARLELTKGELSRKLKISTKTLDSYTAGDTPIPSSKLMAMSKLFGCSMDYLLGLELDDAQSNPA